MKISGTGGTCVPGDQAAVWFHQDPLSWSDEERHPGEHADGPGESILVAAAAGGRLRGEVRPLCRKRTMKQKKNREIRR
jgi:hypothetical protein